MDRPEDVNNVCRQEQKKKKKVFGYLPCALCPGDGDVGKQHKGADCTPEAGLVDGRRSE